MNFRRTISAGALRAKFARVIGPSRLWDEALAPII
jgi:hypothetical protein